MGQVQNECFVRAFLTYSAQQLKKCSPLWILLIMVSRTTQLPTTAQMCMFKFLKLEKVLKRQVIKKVYMQKENEFFQNMCLLNVRVFILIPPLDPVSIDRIQNMWQVKVKCYTHPLAWVKKEAWLSLSCKSYKVYNNRVVNELPTSGMEYWPSDWINKISNLQNIL